MQLTPRLHSGVCQNIDFSWDEVKYMIKHPRYFKGSGSEIQLWSFYNLIDAPELGEFGNPRGIANNVKEVTCMQIDYDGGKTIQSFVKEFDGYTYALYTSKSHSTALNKFRVIIPLAQHIPRDYYSCKMSKEYLQSLFPGCDKTTFDKWRKQRVPYVTPDSVHHYKCHITEGKLFALDMNILHSNMVESVDIYKKRVYSNDVVNMNGDFLTTSFDDIERINKLNYLLDKYKDELSSIHWLDRGNGENVHERSRTVIYSLRMNGMHPSDVYDLVMSYCPHKESLQKEMHDMCFGGNF